MRVNIRCHICCEPATSNSRQLFCTDVVILYKSLFTEKNGSNTKKQQRKHKYKQSETNDHILVVFNRYCSVPPIPFLCIVTNLKSWRTWSTVQERYLTIIRRVQERRPIASRGTLTTGGSVLLPALANNRVHSRSHKWSGPAAGKKVAERRVPELIPVLSSQPAGGVSHKPGNRLPLLFARPAVTSATLKRADTNFAAW